MTTHAYYNEHDPFAAAWLRELVKDGQIAPGDVDERSIEDVAPNELAGYDQCHFFAGIGGWSRALRLAGWPDDRPVWTGSCPCQPFSAAGKRAGFADERHLWPAWQWLIQQRRPGLVFGEQVASDDALDWLDLVFTDLEALGYTCGPVDFPAAGAAVGIDPLAQQALGRLEAYRRFVLLAGDWFRARQVDAAISLLSGLGRGAPIIRQRLWFVACAGSPERERGAGSRTGTRGAESGRPPGQSARRGDVGRMAGPHDTGLEIGTGHPGIHGGSPGTREGQATERGGPADGLGGAAGERRGETGRRGGRPQERAGDTSQPVQLGSPAGGGFGEPGRSPGDDGQREQSSGPGGLDGTDKHGAQREGGAERGPMLGRGPVNGFWADAGWVWCRPERDGKPWTLRPVEPGTFPLAHGVPARVGRLRGYGNAINAEAAAAFVRAACAAEGVRG